MIFRAHNNVNLLVLEDANDDELFSLEKTFNKQIEGWNYKKKHFKKKKNSWNGVVEMFKNSKYMPLGLYGELSDMCKKFNYECQILDLHKRWDNEIQYNEFKDLMSDLLKNYKDTPREYQFRTAFDILKTKMCLGELATSAGKTLILFMTVAYQLIKHPEKKILIVVPNVDLVEQSINDFYEYDCDNVLKLKAQAIYSGQRLIDDANIVVGTYQSLVNKDKEYFKQFNTCIIDEVHQAQSVSIKTVLQRCLHCEYRYGVSGTIQKPETIDRWNVMSYTGPIISEVKVKWLMDNGYVTKAEIKVLRLKYTEAETLSKNLASLYRNKERTKLLGFERDYVQNHDGRLNFITDLISKSKKNSLVLFHERVYGEKLFESIKSKTDNHYVYYIDGNTPQENREFYKSQAELYDNVIIVASFGTFSTGINVRNLHYIFLTESFKSDRIIRQSIGRGLRLNDNKDVVMIIDFVDDLSYYRENKRIWSGYLYRHGLERILIYNEQGFEYRTKSFLI